MLKICTSFSKKVPAEEEYSSQQYHTSIEQELSDGLSAEEIQEKVRETFSLVKQTVENQISEHRPQAAPVNRNGGSTHRQNVPANGNGEKATNRQVKYALNLASDQKIGLGELNEFIQRHYGVESIYQLSKKDASALVDQLKRGMLKVAA